MSGAIISFKPSNVTSAITFLVVFVFMFSIAFFKSKQIGLSLYIASFTGIVLYAITNLFGRVKLITINRKEKTAQFITQVFIKQRVIQVLLKEISVTYKDEIGAKGTKRPSLKIYQNDNLFLEIIPGISGWSESVLKDVVTQIQMEQAELI